MIKFPVSAAKAQDLFDRMERLEIYEKDIKEQFIRGSGAGGQKINKTSSSVYLKHLPTGLECKCQISRQLSLNRFHARRQLCDLIEQQKLGKLSEKQKLISKLRRQKAKRSKRSKEKVLTDKRYKSNVKNARKKITGEN